MKIDIAGVQVDNITKQEAIAIIDGFMKAGMPRYIVTPYSELVVFAQEDESYRTVLNNADLSLPDGIGILWAAKFLSLGRQKQFSIFNFQFSKLIASLAAIIFNPKYIRSVIHEQVTGRELIWDITKLAADNNFSLALVGGHDSVAALSANKLKKKFPNLKINLIVSGNVFDEQLIGEIARSKSDILLIGYSPPKQETWIAENLANLNVKVAIGLGGTFDYIAGKRPQAPKLMHYLGLEWLWRLITQPWRIKRMWNAVPVFIWKIYRYKHDSRNSN